MGRQRPLTEAEWLAAENPVPLLEYLRQHHHIARDSGGRRRLRLFACACCRSVWEHFHDERCRRAVEVSERFADGFARRAELDAARQGAEEADRVVRQQLEPGVLHRLGAEDRLTAVVGYRVATAALWTATTQSAVRAAADVARAVQELRAALAEAVASPRPTFAASLRAEGQAQAALVRDIFGNPFRPVSVDRSCLSGNGAAAVELARAIYDERAFDRLPALADALEETGCLNADLLAHCRQSVKHSRGCWCLDLILSRQ
jgi:hypothetical protein